MMGKGLERQREMWMEERQQVGEAERGRLSRNPLREAPEEKGRSRGEQRPQEEGGQVKFRKNGKGVHIKVPCMGLGRLEKPGWERCLLPYRVVWGLQNDGEWEETGGEASLRSQLGRSGPGYHECFRVSGVYAQA